MKKILVVLLGIIAMMSVLQAAEINGIVVNNQNEGVEGIVVELNGFHFEEEISMETTTAEEGSFNFQDLTQGFFLLQVIRENGIPVFANVEIQSDDQIVDDVIIQLHSGNAPPMEGDGTITGTVINDDEELVSGAVVMAFTENEEHPGMHFNAEANEAGIFVMENLPYGEYFLAAFEGMRDGNGGNGGHGNFPELEDMVSVTISEENPNIEGIVLTIVEMNGGNGGHNDPPVGNSTLTITVTPELEIAQIHRISYFLMETEEEYIFSGRFDEYTQTIENLPAGNYVLAIQAPRHEEWIYDNAATFEEANLIELNEDDSFEVIAELNAMTLDFYTVSGTISNGNGDAIENAYITIHNNNHMEEFEAITNENGEYSIEVPHGMYMLTAFAEGYMMSFWPNNDYMSLEFLQVHEDLDDIDFILSDDPWQEFVISGNVTIEGQTPESDQHVLIVAVSSEEDDADVYTESTMCRDDGSYDLVLDQPGQFYVVAITSGTIPEYYSDAYDWEDANLIELGTEPVDGLNFDLLLPESQGVENVTGTIYNTNGAAVSNATVIMLDSENMPIAFASTNQDGQYNVSFLAAQDYTMKATKIHYQSVENIVNPGTDDIVNITLNEMTVDNDEINAVSAKLENYPNPFNPETTIHYTVPANGNVNLTIYNVRGQKVKTLVNTQKNTGTYQIRWDGKDKAKKDVASGVYMMKLSTSNVTQMKKIMLMK